MVELVLGSSFIMLSSISNFTSDGLFVPEELSAKTPTKILKEHGQGIDSTVTVTLLSIAKDSSILNETDSDFFCPLPVARLVTL